MARLKNVFRVEIWGIIASQTSFLLEKNGKPDYRIQKFNEITRQYNDMYYLDSGTQLDCCLEDFEYTKWLDPDPEVSAYAGLHGDTVKSPYINT